jgi:hypothetical protein
MRPSRLSLIPILFLGLAIIPASRGEFSLMCWELGATRKALVARVMVSEQRGPVKPIRLQGAADPTLAGLGQPPAGKMEQTNPKTPHT